MKSEIKLTRWQVVCIDRLVEKVFIFAAAEWPFYIHRLQNEQKWTVVELLEGEVIQYIHFGYSHLLL